MKYNAWIRQERCADPRERPNCRQLCHLFPLNHETTSSANRNSSMLTVSSLQVPWLTCRNPDKDRKKDSGLESKKTARKDELVRDFPFDRENNYGDCLTLKCPLLHTSLTNSLCIVGVVKYRNTQTFRHWLAMTKFENFHQGSASQVAGAAACFPKPLRHYIASSLHSISHPSYSKHSRSNEGFCHHKCEDSGI